MKKFRYLNNVNGGKFANTSFISKSLHISTHIQIHLFLREQPICSKNFEFTINVEVIREQNDHFKIQRDITVVKLSCHLYAFFAIHQKKRKWKKSERKNVKSVACRFC